MTLLGICGWCGRDIKDGESWVLITETLQGLTVKVRLHVPQCLEDWRDRTQPMDTRVGVNVVVDIKSEDKQ